MDSRRFVVLVVDDEDRIRSMIGEQLSDDGYDVILAPNGDAALEILQSDALIDLIITDVRMPGKLNGFDLVAEAGRLRPFLRTIIMSGYSLEAGRLMSGADRFLAKPFTMRTLESQVQILLAA